MKLPGATALYSPCYEPAIRVPGDIVLFAPACTEIDCVFLGQIRDIIWVGEGESKQRFYEVQCIKRRDGRAAGTMVNQMGIVKIFAHSIICELKPHPK